MGLCTNCVHSCNTPWIESGEHWKRSFSIKLAFFDVILFPAIRVRNKILLLFLQFILQHFRGPDNLDNLEDSQKLETFAVVSTPQGIDLIRIPRSFVSSAFQHGLVHWRRRMRLKLNIWQLFKKRSRGDSLDSQIPIVSQKYLNLKRASFYLL